MRWMQRIRKAFFIATSNRRISSSPIAAGSRSWILVWRKALQWLWRHPHCRGGVQVVYGNNNWATTAQGVTPDYMTLRDYTIMSGRFFSTQDVDSAAKTAVLGETVAK